MRTDRGFTLLELMVAIVMLAVGLLSLVTTSALVTRMNTRAQRAEAAAIFAAQRAERLRASGCASQAAGADTLFRSGSWAVINSWAFTDIGNSTWRAVVTTSYRTVGNVIRTAVLEMEIPCRF